LDTLKENGLLCNAPPSVFPMKDENDRAFYDAAKATGAFLVTGNKKHYPDEPFILTPREFAENRKLEGLIYTPSEVLRSTTF